MTDEELSISDATLIARLRTLATDMFQSGHWGNDLDTTKDAADRIEALLDVRDTLRCLLAKQTARAEQLAATNKRLEVAADYILDGMGIHAPDYEIDPDDDFLDAANSDWVCDVLTRLAAALKGADHE